MIKLSPFTVNSFMFFKLPLAWISGMRLQELTASTCMVRIKHRWINQNPFKSMFWAAQGMAAEFSTGMLVMQAIRNSNRKVSMLVTHQEGNFYKKATGKVIFSCDEGTKVIDAIQKSVETQEGQIIYLHSKGVNQDGITVSEFTFQWSIKVKP